MFPDDNDKNKKNPAEMDEKIPDKKIPHIGKSDYTPEDIEHIAVNFSKLSFTAKKAAFKSLKNNQNFITAYNVITKAMEGLNVSPKIMNTKSKFDKDLLILAYQFKKMQITHDKTSKKTDNRLDNKKEHVAEINMQLLQRAISGYRPGLCRASLITTYDRNLMTNKRIYLQRKCESKSKKCTKYLNLVDESTSSDQHSASDSESDFMDQDSDP